MQYITCHVALFNVSSDPIAGLWLRVEMHTARGRAELASTQKSPTGTMQPGEHLGVTVTSDIREEGQSALVCYCHYTLRNGEARQGHVPFRFTVQ